MVKKILVSSVVAATVFSSSLFAGDFKGISVGVQSSGFESSGLSVKYDINDKITAQAILGAIGTVTNYSGRILYNFKKDKYFTYYGYGSVGSWSWSNSFYSETVIGYGAGAGLDYNIQNADKDLPPIFLSAEAGFSMVDFSHYSYGGLGIGIGIHYKF